MQISSSIRSDKQSDVSRHDVSGTASPDCRSELGRFEGSMSAYMAVPLVVSGVVKHSRTPPAYVRYEAAFVKA